MQNDSHGAFCNTLDLHQAKIGIENQFLVFFLSGRLRQVLLYLEKKCLGLSNYCAKQLLWVFGSVPGI